MEVEGQQQEPSGAAELGTGGNALRTSDLKAQEGVGRCYYTQLPRLVKVPNAVVSVMACVAVVARVAKESCDCLACSEPQYRVMHWCISQHDASDLQSPFTSACLLGATVAQLLCSCSTVCNAANPATAVLHVTVSKQRWNLRETALCAEVSGSFCLTRSTLGMSWVHAENTLPSQHTLTGTYAVAMQVPGMTPHQLTALNLDKTAVLEDLIQRKYQGKSDGLLGELQFSFLAFLMGHSLEGIASTSAVHALSKQQH